MTYEEIAEKHTCNSMCEGRTKHACIIYFTDAPSEDFALNILRDRAKDGVEVLHVRKAHEATDWRELDKVQRIEWSWRRPKRDEEVIAFLVVYEIDDK